MMKKQVLFYGILAGTMMIASCGSRESKPAPLKPQETSVLPNLKRVDSELPEAELKNPSLNLGDGAGERLSEKDLMAANSSVSADLSADLVRNEINTGKVKKISLYRNKIPRKSFFFNEGEEVFKDSEKTKRDVMGRLVSVHEGKTNFTHRSYEYLLGDKRPNYEHIAMGSVDPDEGEMYDGFVYNHYYYNGESNERKACVFAEGQDFLPVYITYDNYQRDDKGNWIKRKVTVYSFDEDNDSQTAQYYQLASQVEEAKSEPKRIAAEQKLIALLKAHATKETYTETRTIIYIE